MNLVTDRVGGIWVTTIKSGAFRYHPDYATTRYKSVFNSSNLSEDDYSSIWGFAEDSANDIYVVSQQRGLGVINSSSGEVKFSETFSDFANSITYWDVEIDTKGTFWVASSNGIYVLRQVEASLMTVCSKGCHHFSIQRGRFGSGGYTRTGKTIFCYGSSKASVEPIKIEIDSYSFSSNL